jgi:enediyne core biosynthesis thioesterase
MSVMTRTPSFDHRHEVTLEETNLVGNVYFAHYLRWQGHCRERFLAERAPGVAKALGADLTMVTLKCSCDYYTELFAMDTVEVRMSLAGRHDNQVEMAFEYYRLGSGAAELVARGRQTIACMRRGPAGLEPAEIPTELDDALEPYRTALALR